MTRYPLLLLSRRPPHRERAKNALPREGAKKEAPGASSVSVELLGENFAPTRFEKRKEQGERKRREKNKRKRKDNRRQICRLVLISYIRRVRRGVKGERGEGGGNNEGSANGKREIRLGRRLAVGAAVTASTVE